MQLSDVLKHHRALLGISRSELSRRSGVDLKVITRLEAGQERAPIAAIPLLLNALDVPVSTRLALVGVD